MRSLARLALAAALVTGFGLALCGTAVAQEDEGDDGDGVAFSSTCQQLQCYFEVSDPGIEGNVSQVQWTFGPNGTNETGNPVLHDFPEPGTYDVSVLVEGEAGNESQNATTASGSGQVTVSEGEVPWSALVFGAVALVGSIGLARMT